MSQSRSERSENTQARAVSQHHAVFADRRRRIVLAELARTETSIDIESLARRVAETERDADAVSSKTVEHVRMTLYHCHLPLLSEFDLVDHDRAAETVRITEHGRERLRTEQLLDDEVATATFTTTADGRQYESDS